jgi:hypothetical protein
MCAMRSRTIVLTCMSSESDNRADDFVARVAVSLRGSEARRHHFLPAHEIRLRAGAVLPIVFGNRRYVFSHKAVMAGYDGTGEQDLYVFTAAE